MGPLRQKQQQFTVDQQPHVTLLRVNKNQSFRGLLRILCENNMLMYSIQDLCACYRNVNLAEMLKQLRFHLVT